MSLQQRLALALRLLWRDVRAGETTLLAVAIVIAVGSLTTVGFFTDRVRAALIQQSNQLLGADITMVSDRPFDPAFEREALERGLLVTRALRFPSMALHADDSALVDVKAVTSGYPLRGEVRLADRLFGEERTASNGPEAGTAWVDYRLLAQLKLNTGDVIGLGQARLKIAALVTQEPDSAIGFINTAPRLLMNLSDVAASELIQTGSRVRYRLYVAGEALSVEDYRTWAQTRIARGQSIEGIRDARPEIRSALERAERYLNLAALLSVVLSGVAIALASRRFLLRHLDGCAVMRCIGASQGDILQLVSQQFLWLGIAAGVLGCCVGYVVQFYLGTLLQTLVAVSLPAPGWFPMWYGIASGVLLLFAFSLPPLLSLGHVSPLRVLRREFGVPRASGIAGYLAGLAVICLLVLWSAGELKLSVAVLGGFLATALVSTGIVLLVLRILSRIGADGAVSWRYGIANMRRHAFGNTVQIIALALGIMALLTLTLVRGDLLQSWSANLRPDTPNRFLINIQPDQIEPLGRFFAARGIESPAFHPMVRGRLVAINDKPVSSADYADDRAKRLVDREFNLSWASRPPTDNPVVAGRWWNDGDGRAGQLSVEQGLAATLRLRLGDRLTYDIAGGKYSGEITSLRQVDWDTFKVNFFVMSTPALLDRAPASYITSFHAPRGQVATLNALIREFPNVVIIDVAQIMSQVQKMIDQVSKAIQFVFLFTLAAGLVVFYAAIASTRDEREFEAAIMRTLGARRRQIATIQLAEFALIGALSGLLAAAGSYALGYFLAVKVLNVPYLGSPWIWLIGIGGGAIGIALAGMFGARRVLDTPPLQSLRRAG